jgi:DNA-binding protein HU-beta
LTKAEIISKIAEKTGVEKAYVTISVESFLEVVKDTMSDGDNIYIRGFGTFINKKEQRK